MLQGEGQNPGDYSPSNFANLIPTFPGSNDYEYGGQFIPIYWCHQHYVDDPQPQIELPEVDNPQGFMMPSKHFKFLEEERLNIPVRIYDLHPGEEDYTSKTNYSSYIDDMNSLINEMILEISSKNVGIDMKTVLDQLNVPEWVEKSAHDKNIIHFYLSEWEPNGEKNVWGVLDASTVQTHADLNVYDSRGLQAYNEALSLSGVPIIDDRFQRHNNYLNIVFMPKMKVPEQLLAHKLEIDATSLYPWDELKLNTIGLDRANLSGTRSGGIHEIGHNWGVLHPMPSFEWPFYIPSCVDTDGLEDTPNMSSAHMKFIFDEDAQIKNNPALSTCTPGVPDEFVNFMGYHPFGCYFTEDQQDVMMENLLNHPTLKPSAQFAWQKRNPSVFSGFLADNTDLEDNVQVFNTGLEVEDAIIVDSDEWNNDEFFQITEAQKNNYFLRTEAWAGQFGFESFVDVADPIVLLLKPDLPYYYTLSLSAHKSFELDEGAVIAKVKAWIDFDRDGEFEDSERISTTLDGGVKTQVSTAFDEAPQKVRFLHTWEGNQLNSANDAINDYWSGNNSLATKFGSDEIQYPSGVYLPYEDAEYLPTMMCVKVYRGNDTSASGRASDGETEYYPIVLYRPNDVAVIYAPNPDESNPNVLFHPNPTRDEVTFKNVQEISQISVLNRKGDLVLDYSLDKDYTEGNFTMDVSKLSPGEYYVHMIVNGRDVQEELIKE